MHDNGPNTKIFTMLLIAAVFITLVCYDAFGFTPQKEQTYQAEVIRVIDGDTVVARIKLGLGVYKIDTIRFLGVDTDEMDDKDSALREKAKLAKEFTQNNIQKASEVYITTVNDKTDKYGRLLGVIWFKIGDKFYNLNQMLVENGYNKKGA